MSQITEYQRGTPCWVDLWTPDREAAMAFYTALFGWEYDVAPADQHFYTTALLHGRKAAGIITPPGPPQPPAWATYLLTDDVPALDASVTELGGQSLTGVVNVPGADEIRMSLLLDPTGAMFGAWQSKGNVGAGIANEPGAFVWNELATPDPATARKFYAAAFGVEISDPVSPDFDTTTLRVAGRDVAGISEGPAGAPAQWGTFFAVRDADEAVATVRAQGGAVPGEPTDTPYGRIAVCADPQGATFAVMSTAE
jgi:predicted enzyme related to lactoylglutathione lyase